MSGSFVQLQFVSLTSVNHSAPWNNESDWKQMLPPFLHSCCFQLFIPKHKKIHTTFCLQIMSIFRYIKQFCTSLTSCLLCPLVSSWISRICLNAPSVNYYWAQKDTFKFKKKVMGNQRKRRANIMEEERRRMITCKRSFALTPYKLSERWG